MFSGVRVATPTLQVRVVVRARAASVPPVASCAERRAGRRDASIRVGVVRRARAARRVRTVAR